ncbi:MAG TPA: hypothetical protein ENJ65_00665 [Candidatus Tenderia electrophaga]|uniref:Uncharacterized protein n=1 Tax=Candidatus Tenderia electrophaga TaxID=1748243 RepID=A0A832J284_9GAMM|nr:hypothetical protein [Candidatus Tenderia electrophaga]
MKSIDVALVRFLQFLVLLFFTFAVFLWYGCIALAPLAIWVNLTDFFSAAFSPITSAIIAFIIIGAIGVYLSTIPKLVETFMITGADLIRLGNSSVKRMGEMLEAVKNDAPPQEKKVDIILTNK